MSPLPYTVMESPNQDDRPEGQGIDTLVLHYTGMPTAQAALARMLDPAAQVSAHWLVHEEGRLVALVPEARRAWHAGRSFWRGHTALNTRSIGIEIVNPGHEFGYRPFPEAQMRSVVALCREILRRHPAIVPVNVVAHADIAPTRKEDPGELFDWPRLAAAGVGLWPGGDEAPPPKPEGSADDAAALLAHIGYDVSDLAAALKAFQRHYLPASLGQAPVGPTWARLWAVARASGPIERD
ncbi:N-acetylmuramoyl-L-alanine amidase [Pararhodospirillum photometricum]|uniref:N-acetylmuramoyl-L-alanine amidase n=1 Tax=Pararhodospirillum photometricum DSM 122 TaxID=1150469 RepID=H6SNV1_PARPM|nr:N-acetylmuramoyl-L-alanine amidase [Pararhodospirillum photometricum]CCG07023.1 AmpD (Negative regulator of AmpC) [Pararhodospirillum photometricum DSM 122]